MSADTSRRWRQAWTGLAARLVGGAYPGRRHSLAIQQQLGCDRLLAMFVLASLPAALIVAQRAGVAMIRAQATTPDPDWRLALTSLIGIDPTPDNVAATTFVGALMLLRVFGVAALVSAAWAIVFAAMRDRLVDPAWLMTAWLFTLMLPSTTPIAMVAIGATFSALFGMHLFGGSGRYIASPAVVGALFLQVAYPLHAVDAPAWQWPADVALTSALADGGQHWWTTFLGVQSGLPGVGAAGACVLGAVWLAATGVVSHRTLLGGVMGLLAATLLAWLIGGSAMLPHWHFVLGSAAFGWAFLLTDPSTLPITRAGRWLHGALFGGLLVLMRHGDPTHPESTLFAVLLAGLFVPLIDFVVLRWHFRGKSAAMEIVR